MIAALVYTDGFSVLLRTWEVSCPLEGHMQCDLHYKNGTPIILQAGETLIINEHDNELIPLINWTAIIMLLLIFLVNHLIYNRHYKFTKERMKRILKQEVLYWIRPIIWIANLYDKYVEKDEEEK